MTKTLILVHPGSLMGSATMHLGDREAASVRENVFSEVSDHEGAFVVIDGALSDELRQEQNLLIADALERAKASGHEALRVWGDDAGEEPFEDWPGFSQDDHDLHIYQGQQEAARNLAGRLPAGEVILTGAWVDDEFDSGCVRSVERALRGELGAAAKITISETAARMPCAQDDNAEEFSLPAGLSA